MRKIITIMSIVVFALGVFTTMHSVRIAQGTINYSTDTSTIIVTKDGNIWEMDKMNNQSCKVILVFNTQGTKDVTDDTIEGVYEV